MYILRIEHSVPSMEAWKKVFDSDPLGRKQGGVLRHRISRVLDQPNRVLVDLEFDSLPQAETFRTRLLAIWQTPQGQIAQGAQARILEVTEDRDS
jgi:ribosomal protein L35AE/L33A